MDKEEVEKGVDEAVARWAKIVGRRRPEAELTLGAKAAIVQMVVHIEKDPSPYWGKVDHDDVQRYVVEILPNILVDLSEGRYRYRFSKHSDRFSSWEIWHNISEALEKWCPIPKDI